MVLSSCRTRSYSDEVHMCAFNLSVNEMRYQSASEKLLSVQVFMCQCLYMCVCVCVCVREAVCARAAGQV